MGQTITDSGRICSVGSILQTTALTIIRQKKSAMKKSWEERLQYTLVGYKDFTYLNSETNIWFQFFLFAAF